jgi:imidazolonepropionase-like amidohydrolase
LKLLLCARALAFVLAALVFTPTVTWASEPESPAVTLFENVRIFDGVDEELTAGTVLVEGNAIARVAETIEAPPGARVIDGGGRTLMPGLIDAHYHIAWASMSYWDLAGSGAPDLDFIGIVAAGEMERVLMRGFTSIRELAGPSWGVKLAADRGLIAGPRVWPSLRALSQFGGHGDFNARPHVPREFGGPENLAERAAGSRIVNGVPEMLAAAREQMKQGASQIKIMAGGGYGSEFDPIDGDQFTPEEIRAAVAVAENLGTYVSAHIYTPRGIRIAVENGVRAIEHGNLADAATLKMMAKKDVWLSPQVLTFSIPAAALGPERRAKQEPVLKGLDDMFKAAKRYGVKIAFGTDIVFDAKAAARQNEEFTLRTQWFEPVEILRQATSLSGEFLQMSGPRSPYPGRIGVIEPGALADILLVDGDPITDLEILTRPHETISLIMKNGVLYKNTLPDGEAR